MKSSVEINLPMDKVIELFLDKNNLKEWKKNFVTFGNVSGIPGQVGAVTVLVFKTGNLWETIVSKNLPTEIITDYEHQKTKVVHTTIHNFTSLSENKTLIEEEKYIRKHHSILSRIIIAIFANNAQRYEQDQLNKFKIFAENETR